MKKKIESQWYVDADFLEDRPELKAVLFSMLTLLAVAMPLLGQLPLSVGAVFVGFWLLRVILLILGMWILPRWQRLILLIGSMALVWLQLGTLIGLQGGIAFLMMLALLKSYEGKGRRDWQVLVCAMLFLIAGAVLFDQQLLTGLWVLVCLVLMTVTLASLNGLHFKMALHQSLLGFALTLPIMLVLFIGMPRRDTPLWSVMHSSAKASTGMSDIMKPGSIGNLVQSNEPVFSAIFDDGFRPSSSQLYWRVMIMNEQKNGAWQVMNGYVDDAVPVSKTTNYQIIVEDDRGRIPALDYPLEQKQRNLTREAGDILKIHSAQGVRRIQLSANLSGQLPQKLNTGEIAFYTSLPANHNLRTYALARELWRQSGNDTERFISLVYEYFRKQNFSYTLKPPVLNGTDNTDDFLFSSKKGFCEHYADAFTTMMRAAGVPARVVTGYQGGEFHPDGHFWQIRSKNAHAWTEVWVASKQAWIRADPTAAVSEIRIEQGLDSALPENEIKELVNNRTQWAKFLDQSRFYWQQWVVNYDNSSQKGLFSQLGLGHISGFILVILMLIGVLVACIPVWLWWQRARRQDILPLEQGFLLLKQALLGNERLDIATLGPLELRNEYDNDLPEKAEKLLNEYIQLNYASNDVAPKRAILSWYKRVERWAKKKA